MGRIPSRQDKGSAPGGWFRSLSGVPKQWKFKELQQTEKKGRKVAACGEQFRC
jgi:hypothetical protein